jgi:hypothetical protein
MMKKTTGWPPTLVAERPEPAHPPSAMAVGADVADAVVAVLTAVVARDGPEARGCPWTKELKNTNPLMSSSLVILFRVVK